MTITNDIAVTFFLLSLIALFVMVFVMVRRQHKRHLPHQDAEEC